MKRTDDSIAFETAWKSVRTEGEFIPDRAQITPRIFKRFLPMMVFAEMDIENHVVEVKLAGTGIRDLIGFEVTGIDFNTLSTDPYSERSINRRAGYHDYPFGRCEELLMDLSPDFSMACELTLFPLWGAEKSRYLTVLVTPLQGLPADQGGSKGYLTRPFTDEVFLDIGAGLPDNGY